MTSISQYTVGAVKTFRGHDGQGYSCNLLRDNKKVAEILEDGWGGGLQFRWTDDKTSAVVHTRTYDDKPHSFKGTVEEALFYAEVMKLPKIAATDNYPEMHTTPDIVVDDMVNDFLVAKKVKADLKKNVTIQCKDNKILSWKITPVHTIDILKAHAIKTYPDAVIMNDLSIPEIIQIYETSEMTA